MFKLSHLQQGSDINYVNKTYVHIYVNVSSHYQPDRILTIFTALYKYLQILNFMVFTEFFYQVPKNLLTVITNL